MNRVELELKRDILLKIHQVKLTTTAPDIIIILCASDGDDESIDEDDDILPKKKYIEFPSRHTRK